MDNHKQFFLRFTTLLIATTLVLISELLLSKILNLFLLPITTIMIVRTVQIFLMVFILKSNPNNLKLSGLSLQNFSQGYKTGLIWSATFGITVLTLYFSLNFIGINTLKYLLIKLPKNNLETILFFITAGLISPIAEELFFRGFIYTYFRKYNAFIAIIISTTFFALPHFQLNTFPVIPIIGGIVFALSFEYSKSLAAPIIIHISGNLTIFLLTLFITGPPL
ncbi:MAG: CPBP family intramembrane metalloprotease [Desulfobacteraceae bacterium]|nr:CPBP family intramembrane metalloprotease [Desulfobacteraceae bacterium]